MKEQNILAAQPNDFKEYTQSGILPDSCEAFYGIWCNASKDEAEAQDAAYALS